MMFLLQGITYLRRASLSLVRISAEKTIVIFYEVSRNSRFYYVDLHGKYMQFWQAKNNWI